MKVGLDANLSPKLVRALNELYGRADLEFVSVGAGKDDVVWLPEFAASGGDAMIGMDQKILSRPHEVHALIQSGLTAFFLNFGKAQPRINMIASRVIYWWPYFEARMDWDAKVFRVPVGTTDPQKFEILEVDDPDAPLRVLKRVSKT